jgi:hypothetical protein
MIPPACCGFRIALSRHAKKSANYLDLKYRGYSIDCACVIETVKKLSGEY